MILALFCNRKDEGWLTGPFSYNLVMLVRLSGWWRLQRSPNECRVSYGVDETAKNERPRLEECIEDEATPYEESVQLVRTAAVARRALG